MFYESLNEKVFYKTITMNDNSKGKTSVLCTDSWM